MERRWEMSKAHLRSFLSSCSGPRPCLGSCPAFDPALTLPLPMALLLLRQLAPTLHWLLLLAQPLLLALHLLLLLLLLLFLLWVMVWILEPAQQGGGGGVRGERLGEVA